MSDFLDLQGAKDLNTDAIHIGAVANSVDPATGAPIDTHVNRVGGTDYTLDGFYKAIGPVVMPWTSVAGGTLTQPNQAFLHPADGNYYSWTGAYPVGGYVVAPGTDPTVVAGYVPRTDVVLRAEITPEISNLIGYDILYKRRPRKVLSKLFSSSSGYAQVKTICFGDSLATAKIQHIAAYIDRLCGGESPSGVNIAGNTAGIGRIAGGSDLDVYNATLTTTETGKYQYWITGTVLAFADTSTATLYSSGANPYFERIRVFYITEPSAGTINLLVGGVVVATANANKASVGLGYLEYTKTYGQAQCSISVTGGTVRYIFSHIDNPTSKSGMDLYKSFSIGGLTLSNGVQHQTANNILASVLNVIQPDLITFEMDDDFGDSGVYDASLNVFKTIIDSSSPLADKLFIGSTPRAANDSLKMRSGDYLRKMCSSEGADYLFFDSYRIMGTYSDMNSIFGTDDGVHPTSRAQAFAAEVIIGSLSLNASYMGKVPRAVNDIGTPSKLAWNSRFSMGNSFDRGSDLSVETDNSFGYDWNLIYPRTLSFKARGQYGTSSSVVWQFSSNTTVNPNVMPLALDFISPGNVRKIATSTASGFEFTQFKKTDNPGGGLMHMQFGLIRTSFTRAELLSINANSVLGSIAFCSDCTGGAQLVYARGGSPTDWVTVDGKNAI